MAHMAVAVHWVEDGWTHDETNTKFAHDPTYSRMVDISGQFVEVCIVYSLNRESNGDWKLKFYSCVLKVIAAQQTYSTKL